VHLHRILLPLAFACAGTKEDEKANAPVQGALDSGDTDTAQEITDHGFEGDVDFDPDERPPERLSELNILHWLDGRFVHNNRVIPYALNSALFSDHAQKHRTIWIPEGTSIQYTSSGVLDFPVGTAITKTFLMPHDLREPREALEIIETRLLIRGSEEWQAWPYIWLDDGSDAILDVTGEVRTIELIDPDGTPQTANYLIPQRNQCVECHEIRQNDGTRQMTLIGPQARTLNRTYDYEDGAENQLQHLSTLGMLTGMPRLDDVPTSTDMSAVAETVRSLGVDALDPSVRDQAARDYMDINCAHCHNPNAVEGVSSQVWLNHDADDLFHLGVCKRPSSAGEGTGGLDYDIVPGQPEQSVLWYRTMTTNVGAMMPQIGRSLSDSVGSQLIAAWITHLDAPDCSE